MQCFLCADCSQAFEAPPIFLYILQKRSRLEAERFNDRTSIIYPVCMAAKHEKQKRRVSPVNSLFEFGLSLWPLELHRGGQDAILNAESFLD